MKKIEYNFKTLDKMFKFLKNINDYYSFKIQIILEINNNNEIYTKSLPSYIYHSYSDFTNKILHNFNKYLDEYDENNSTITNFKILIYIISDNNDEIEQKLIYLDNIYNNNQSLLTKIKIKIKNLLIWLIKLLKI